MNIYDVYQVCEKHISKDVTEVSVIHVDWNDLQVETEGKNLLITPTGVFLITDRGLYPINENDLWAAIPKIINLNDEDGDPYYSDNRAAKEVIEYLKSCAIKVCPNWGTPIPGRRKSHQ